MKKLGKIEVMVTQRWVLERKPKDRAIPALEEVGIVSEKAAKGEALSHSIE